MKYKQNLTPAMHLFMSLVLPSAAMAEEVSHLPEVVVTAELDSLGQVVKNRSALQQEMIGSSRDLVRYTTDVGINDNGRHSKGFAMRGVEGNRVGISIDGVALPASEENSLYARYGNFNPSRLNIDPELVQSIEMTKGADAFNSGSGALGGNVNFRTLDAADIVRTDHTFGGLFKTGYASKNTEWVNTLGIGYSGEKADAILLYSQRDGHELKSNGRGPIYQYSSSQHPDPARHRNRNYVAKFNYSFNEHHRAGFAISGQDGRNYTDERSYTNIGSLWREADDHSERLNTNLYYLYTPESEWISFIKADADYQKTNLAAINYKGTANYIFNTNERNRTLDEIYNRRMETAFKRLTLQIDSQSLASKWGDHQLSFKMFMSRRDFKNVNLDRIGIGTDYQTDDYYTIQYPMRTSQVGLTLKDNIHWNERYSSLVGVRYDFEKVSPQSLNAKCSPACTADGKPSSTIFRNTNVMAGLAAQVNQAWKVAYQFSSGYRVPTASELYFTFKNPYGSWKANPNLKAEQSFTHTLTSEWKSENVQFDLSVYQADYRNFLFEQESLIEKKTENYEECKPYCQKTFITPMQQMVNLDKAQIRGIEMKSSLKLESLAKSLSGFVFSTNLGYSKGKLSSDNSLLSIQPLKVIVGLDYLPAHQKWGVFSRLTYLGAKKAKDAQVVEYVGINYKRRVTAYKYLNKSAYVFDLFGFYKPLDNLTLRFGVYNLFNTKYHTWDALRGINAHSTTNSVDSAGKGLQRFYAPGRNYAASMEIRF